MYKQRGFTLIELIIVIVILGILAVTAAPSFINFSTDARVNVLKNISAAIEAAAEQSYLKAAIVGAEKQSRSSAARPPEVTINGISMELKYGYPEALADAPAGGDILDLLVLSDDLEVCYSVNCSASNSSRVKIGYDTTEGTGCYVRYSEPGGTGAPSATMYGLEIVTDGC
ncbi:prepilin-type cleavage/methylation domain-containing protein [Pseudidiomarina sediminum]|uniref:Prepilin-type cleavage/methylation domain-containing protein n=1 Tax=Pseudidiomarina sediminum TaxID=431675 RepID=A0A432YZE0_9GAMM|nr:prepilin-type N-terminal cleavage/methylation domain-containing protein [Pseudidiomarina sediminum]RUO68980.1 prepilin-type cleavage/methylation domain-containing protein [Pseudidiomarina sediminum]